MDDLIKRQDAIDACLNGFCACVSDCVDEIEKLPSAEPDKDINVPCKDPMGGLNYNRILNNLPPAEPVIRCKDCEHDGYCCRLSSRTPNDYCSHAKRRTDE